MILGNKILIGSSGEAPLYDGVSVIYEIERPDMTVLWTNAIFKIRRDSDGATAFLFFENHSSPSKGDTITLNSLIHITSDTSPSGTTLSTWLGANSGFVERWYGMTDDNSIVIGKQLIQTTTSKQPKFADAAGNIFLKNGKPTIDFRSDLRYLKTTTANADLDNGKDFTIFTVNNNVVSGSSVAILSNHNNQPRFAMFADRGVPSASIVVKNTGGTAKFWLLSAQDNTSNQILLTFVVDGTAKSGELFKNGVSQDTNTWTGTYSNTEFKLAVQLVTTSPLNGTIQLVAIFPNNTVDRGVIDTDIDTRYSIP